MKRIRKPTDKEIHSAALPRRRTGQNSHKEKTTPLAVPGTLRVESKNILIEWHAPSVTLSSRDRASQLMLSENQMSCEGVEVRSWILLHVNIVNRSWILLHVNIVKTYCDEFPFHFNPGWVSNDKSNSRGP